MTRSLTTTQAVACGLILVSLTACSTIENTLGGEKVDYRTGARQTTGLDVPPDLTQLANSMPAANKVVSAAALQEQKSNVARPAQATQGGLVALNAAGDIKLEREGATRYLRTSASPEVLWPQVRGFWQEAGFELPTEQAEIGVLETNWLENRAKLPQDFIRRSLGSLLDGLYSTGERDKYRTRIERVEGGSAIYIYHRGMQEVYTSTQRDNTAWQPRAADAALEAEMLSRLMLKLGGTEIAAKAVKTEVASAAPKADVLTPLPDAKALAAVPDSLAVAEDFDRAWRRVGQSLDRHGFTVEDRDRKQGLFFLRYADPTKVGKEEPGFFAKLFGKGEVQSTGRYRVSVKSEGNKSTIMVLNAQGQQQTDENAKRILALLQADMK